MHILIITKNYSICW